jgi:hypothetical protein
LLSLNFLQWYAEIAKGGENHQKSKKTHIHQTGLMGPASYIKGSSLPDASTSHNLQHGVAVAQVLALELLSFRSHQYPSHLQYLRK